MGFPKEVQGSDRRYINTLKAKLKKGKKDKSLTEEEIAKLEREIDRMEQMANIYGGYSSMPGF